jgi:hypothetical protein
MHCGTFHNLEVRYFVVLWSPNGREWTPCATVPMDGIKSILSALFGRETPVGGAWVVEVGRANGRMVTSLQGWEEVEDELRTCSGQPTAGS